MSDDGGRYTVEWTDLGVVFGANLYFIRRDVSFVTMFLNEISPIYRRWNDLLYVTLVVNKDFICMIYGMYFPYF